jgi:hypothetical protein
MGITLEKYLSRHARLLVANSAEHCLNLLIGELGHGSYYFRGLSDEQYQLLSSLDRIALSARHFIFAGKEIQNRFREQLFLREFKKIAHNHLHTSSIPATQCEWLSLMQHYGIPTRLIDLTKSPFIALYFAVRDWFTEKNAVIWAISPHAFHEASFHRLKRSGFPHSMTDTNYNYSQMHEFLNDDFFDEAFLTDKYDIAMILNPNWASSRLAAQQGAFLIKGSSKHSLEDTLVDLIHDKSHMDPREAEMHDMNRIDMSIRKLIIPSGIKKKLFIQLYRMNIHAATLFPGIEGAARGVMEYGAMEEWESHMETR